MRILDRFYLLDAGDRNHSIEGLRGLSVLMVFNVHFFSLHTKANYYCGENDFLLSIFKMLNAGHIGVDIFFVISGFFIWKILFIDKVPYVKYMVNRIERLMPTYLLNTSILASFSAFSILGFIQNVFFLPQVFPGTVGFYNFVTWTLAWEWLFYLLIFCVAIVTARSKKVATMLLISVSIIYLSFSFQLFGEQNYVNPVNVMRFSGFFFGCALAEHYTRFQGPVFRMMGYLSVPCILFGSYIWGNYYEKVNLDAIRAGLYYIYIDIVAMATMIFLLNFKTIFRTFLEFKPIRALGQVSYTFYLTHGVVLVTISNKLITFNSFVLMLISYVIYFLICFLTSTLLFYLTERPYLLGKVKRTPSRSPQGVRNPTSMAPSN